MARLHAANRYDRRSRDVETITGRPALSVRDFVMRHADRFMQNSTAANRASR
jgi:NAD(P)H dehydrogenase (quinone)